MKYFDPDSHVRLRFIGNAELLVGKLMPHICDWATGLMSSGPCLRFSFDTYDREIDRYGGPEGVSVAEQIFQVDSWCVTELLNLSRSTSFRMDRTTLAILSLDSFLAGLGLDSAARVEWSRSQLQSRKEASADFQKRKQFLRNLLGSPAGLSSEAGGEQLAQVLSLFRNRLFPPAESLKAIERSKKLSRTLDSLWASFVHMHLNRLGVGAYAERNVVALLWRVRQSLLRAPMA